MTDHVGRRVTTDVGKFLGAHVRDRARQGRNAQRKALRDPARMDPRSMERHSTLLAGRPQVSDVPLSGVEPVERSHHVDTRLQNPSYLLSIGKKRRVEHAVRPKLEDRVHVVRCLHPQRAETANLSDVTVGLVFAVNPSAHELELWVGHDPLDCRATHVSGRPLNHT